MVGIMSAFFFFTVLYTYIFTDLFNRGRTFLSEGRTFGADLRICICILKVFSNNNTDLLTFRKFGHLHVRVLYMYTYSSTSKVKSRESRIRPSSIYT